MDWEKIVWLIILFVNIGFYIYFIFKFNVKNITADGIWAIIFLIMSVTIMEKLQWLGLMK